MKEEKPEELEKLYEQARKTGNRLAAISYLCDPHGLYGDEEYKYFARIGLGELFFDMVQKVAGISMDYEQLLKDQEGGGERANPITL